MDWIAVGAISEIVGAVALVLTLAYLALQVNHATQAARRAATERAVDSVREWSMTLIDNPDVADTYWKGTEGLENLSNQRERSQFGVMSLTCSRPASSSTTSTRSVRWNQICGLESNGKCEGICCTPVIFNGGKNGDTRSVKIFRISLVI